MFEDLIGKKQNPGTSGGCNASGPSGAPGQTGTHGPAGHNNAKVSGTGGVVSNKPWSVNNPQFTYTCDLLDRVGSFELSCYVFDNVNDQDMQYILSYIFSNTIVFKADFHATRNSVLYFGYSKNFDVVSKGCKTVMYDIIVSKNANGSIKIDFVRRP
jgi:hypothetical protein